MDLIYKLIITISNNFNSNFVRKFENIVIQKFELEFKKIEFTNIDSDSSLKYQMLAINESKVSSPNIPFKVLIFIYRKRLFRYLIFVLNPIGLSDPSVIFSLNKYELIKMIIKNYKIIIRCISSRVQLVNAESKNFSEYIVIKSQSIFQQKNVLENFPRNSKYIFEPNWKVKVINDTPDGFLRTLLLIRVMCWNSYRLFLFFKKHDLDANYYLSKFCPFMFEMFREFNRVKVIDLPMNDRTIDIHNSDSRIQTLTDTEIWSQIFIVRNNSLLNTDRTASPLNSFVAGLSGITLKIKQDSEYVLVRKSATTYRNFESAIYLSHRVDFNYFHFLLDTLPKLLALNELPDSIPILIRSDLPRHFEEMLSRISNKKLIRLSDNETVKVHKLFTYPAISSVFDSKVKKPLQRVNYSLDALLKIRANLLSTLHQTTETHDFVFVVRKDNRTKRLLNRNRVIKLLRNYNFFIVQEDQFFYRNQANIFFNAKLIVVMGGGALANLIFVNSNTRVIVLESFFSHRLGIWKKLSEGLRINSNYLVGIPFSLRRRSNRIHSNYFVSIRKLRKTVDREITSIT
jgi:hypothetical protein